MSVGFGVGFDTIGIEQSGNQSVAPIPAHRFPPPTGEFESFANEELKNEMIKLADHLSSFGYGIENNDKIKEVLPLAVSLASEALRRTGDIPNPQNDFGPSVGRIIVLSGSVTGAFPAICTSSFLRHIAEHL